MRYIVTPIQSLDFITGKQRRADFCKVGNTSLQNAWVATPADWPILAACALGPDLTWQIARPQPCGRARRFRW